MKAVLILIILILGAGGYYEYTILQQSITDSQSQVTALDVKMTMLQAEKEKMTEDKAALAKQLADTQGKVTTLTAQVKDLQGTVDQAKKDLDLALHPPAPKPTAPPPPTDPNDLGTIVTLVGQTYQKCELLKVDGDGITVSHTQGITKILFAFLPLDLQKRFGFDPHQAAALTKAQVKYDDDMHKNPPPDQ